MNRTLHQLFMGVQIFYNQSTDVYYVQGTDISLPSAAHARMYIGLFIAPNTPIGEELPTLN